MNYTTNIFKYSNYTYTLLVNLYNKTNDPTNDMCISFDAADIEEVVYESKLNDLLVKGHIIYTDKYAAVDKLINQQYCYCDILFAQNKKSSDNEVGMSTMDEEKMFSHTFIATNIKVLARSYSLIKYQIDIISLNWFNCAANLSFSNYEQKPQPIFDIIKSCIISNKLKVDDDTFNRVKAPVAINYISKKNDNIFTALNYLMHKLYYSSSMRDDSMKFVVYDLKNNKYRLFDLKDKYTYVGSYSTIISFFKTNVEAMVQQDPINIGSFKSPCPKQNLYSNLFNKHMYGYDLNYDKILDNFIQSDEIVNYMNNMPDADGYDRRYEKMFTFPNMSHEYNGMYWNNTFDVYNESIVALEENNALILNVAGEVGRQSGSMNTVILDRSMANLASEDKKELEKMKKKYKAYEGMWVASKVKNIICPAAPSFRQQIALFRNFAPKIEAII